MIFDVGEHASLTNYVRSLNREYRSAHGLPDYIAIGEDFDRWLYEKHKIKIVTRDIPAYGPSVVGFEMSDEMATILALKGIVKKTSHPGRRTRVIDLRLVRFAAISLRLT